jgi:P-type Mg2+ transporter
LSIGDIVPADAKILFLDNFLINQSVLTGESFPLEKKLNEEVFAGSVVIGGIAYCEVTKTGQTTMFGKIAEKLVEKREKTAFEIGIDKFSFLLLKVSTLIISIIVSIALIKNIFLKQDFSYNSILEILLLAISIGVGVAPELLPAIVSLNLTRGSLKMNKKGALVKN